MLNRMLCVFAACSFAAVTALAGDKSAKDAKSLQGTWQAVYLETNGEKSPDDQVKELKIVFKGYQVFAVKPEGEGQKCKFKLGTSKRLPITTSGLPCTNGMFSAGIPCTNYNGEPRHSRCMVPDAAPWQSVEPPRR
jgi:hypothetical protein